MYRLFRAALPLAASLAAITLPCQAALLRQQQMRATHLAWAAPRIT